MYKITTLLLLLLSTACANIIGPPPEPEYTASGAAVISDDKEELRKTLIALRQKDKLEREGRMNVVPSPIAAKKTAATKQPESVAQEKDTATQDVSQIREQLWVRISFKSGRTAVPQKMAKALADIAGKYLAKPRNQTLVVRGFCDGEPIGGYSGKHQSKHGFNNQITLSRARAQAVADILISSGIRSDVIEVEGYGADYFIADNATAAGRDQNRRVDVFLAGR